ncbi:hypothetical protein [Acinetobacter sp.]|uniref:hypothetical protein n=1 Tax=Acinetobacter sp. TaxID=472 RepID=UPI003CFD657E
MSNSTNQPGSNQNNQTSKQPDSDKGLKTPQNNQQDNNAGNQIKITKHLNNLIAIKVINLKNSNKEIKISKILVLILNKIIMQKNSSKLLTRSNNVKVLSYN